MFPELRSFCALYQFFPVGIELECSVHFDDRQRVRFRPDASRAHALVQGVGNGRVVDDFVLKRDARSGQFLSGGSGIAAGVPAIDDQCFSIATVPFVAAPAGISRSIRIAAAPIGWRGVNHRFFFAFTGFIRVGGTAVFIPALVDLLREEGRAGHRQENEEDNCAHVFFFRISVQNQCIAGIFIPVTFPAASGFMFSLPYSLLSCSRNQIDRL